MWLTLQGFDIIYEARDLDIPQNEREGFTQARSDVESTKARVKASEARIDSDLEPFIKKNYWTEAREQLRRQVRACTRICQRLHYG